MFRNRWSQCSGIGGNNKTEWVVTLLRNTQQTRVVGDALESGMESKGEGTE